MNLRKYGVFSIDECGFHTTNEKLYGEVLAMCAEKVREVAGDPMAFLDHSGLKVVVKDAPYSFAVVVSESVIVDKDSCVAAFAAMHGDIEVIKIYH